MTLPFPAGRPVLRAAVVAASLAAAGVSVRGELFISEFVASNSTGLRDEDGDESDWIELHNAGQAVADLAGYYLTDDATELDKWRLPAVTIPAGGYLVVFASDKDRADPAGELHTNFRLSATGEYLALVAPDGETVVHEYAPAYPPQFANVSYGLGAGASATPLIGSGSPCHARVPESEVLGLAWTARGFDDGEWMAGVTGAGYETESGYEFEIGIDLEDVMAGVNSSAYLRVPFMVAELEVIDSLELRIKYDDGLVAYLNGEEVARRNAPAAAVEGDGLAGFASTSNGEGDAVELTSVTIDRGGLQVDYDVSELIGITLTQFVAGSNAANLTTFTGTPAPAPGTRHGLLDGDTDLNTGVINPGGQSAPLTADPTAATPGMAVEFDTPVVNSPGPDVVFFELQTAANPPSGDPVHVSPLNGIGSNGLQSITIDGYDLPFVQGAPLAGFRLWNCASAPSSLDALEATTLTQNGGERFDFRVIGTGIDLSDLGYGEGAAVAGLFFQAKGTNGGVDPVFIAGLPAATLDGLDWTSRATAGRDDSEALQFEPISLAPFVESLVPGENILAIHGLNVAPDDPDFLIVPELDAVRIGLDPGQARFFSMPTAGAENGTGVNDLGPSLTDARHAPEQPGDGEDLVVSVQVDESLNPVDAVRLHYRVAYEPETSVVMVRGDDGRCAATIPAAAAGPGEMLRWRITSRDTAGHLSRLPLYGDRHGSAEYFGTVIADPSLATELPVLHRIVADPAGADTQSGSRASIFWAGEFYDNIFIRLRGRGSRSWPKKSYKVDFNDGEHFRFRAGLPRTDEINLNSTYSDVSYLRTVLCFETWRDVGAPSPDAQLVRVHQNGSFFNISVMIEQIQRDFLRRVGLSDEGALYKMDTNSLESPRYTATSGVEKKNRRDEDHSDLQALMDGLTLTDADLDAFIFDNINLPPELCYLGGCILSQHVSGTVRNYYMYRDTTGSGEWQSLPWDPDISWGYFFGTGTTIHTSTDAPNPLSHPFLGGFDHPIDYGSIPNVTNPFRGVIFRNARTRQMYLRRLRTLMDTFLQRESLVPEANRYYESRIDELAALIAPDVLVDQAAWGGSNNSGAEQPLAAATGVLKSDYLTPRRQHLFETHSVHNPSYADAVGIPDSQPAHPALAIGLLDVNPVSANQDEEFIELINPNSYAVDISGWRVAGAVDHTFAPGTVIPAHDPLDPRANKLYLTPDAAAFRNRSARPRGGEGRFVQGGYDGHLSSFGETIEVREPDGSLVTSRSYPGNPGDVQRYLRISEIMYHPGGDPDAEYVELVNTSDAVALDLSRVRFTEGISFAFPEGTMLVPGARMVVAFAQFANGSRLDNDGETLKLEDATNSTVAEFRYNDASPWPLEADGLGQSLVFTGGDPGDPLNWRASTAPNPGDSDAVPWVPGQDLLAYAVAAGPEISSGRLAVTLSPAADDARVAIEGSADLITWGSEDLPLLARDGQRFVYDLQPVSGPRRFYRLRVTLR